jgi:hypothetical protein
VRCGWPDGPVGQMELARWTWPDGFRALGAPAGFKQVNLSFSNCQTLFRCVYEAASRMCGMFDQVALRAGSVSWTWPDGLGQMALVHLGSSWLQT